jgi:hypothetical protein
MHGPPVGQLQPGRVEVVVSAEREVEARLEDPVSDRRLGDAMGHDPTVQEGHDVADQAGVVEHPPLAFAFIQRVHQKVERVRRALRHPQPMGTPLGT